MDWRRSTSSTLNRRRTMLDEQAIQAFKSSLRGKLVQPGEPDYDDVRALYNGMIDKRPRLIARCVDVADVIAAVNFGRDQGLLVAIRGGGHNGPGLGSCDDGLVIDLSSMRERARRSRRARRSASTPAARRATSITPRTRSGWRCPSASSRPPASPASRSAAAPATSRASTASPSTTCSKRTSSSPTAASSPRARASTPTSSGRCAAAAATSAS